MYKCSLSSLSNHRILPLLNFSNLAKRIMDTHTILHFKSTGEMLDCLTTLPASDISNIRQIRLKSFPFPVYTEKKKNSYHTYNMSSVLPLFPGLALDLITIEDPYHDPGVNDGWGDTGTYFDIQTLIESNGWKELHYFSPTTEFISSRNDAHNGRMLQPAGWDKLLKEKDGEDSGAEVRMFVAKERGLSAADPQTRMEYEAIPGHLLPAVETESVPDSGDALGTDDDDDDDEVEDVVEGQHPPSVDARQVLVVAKRGRDAAYVQNGSDLDKKIKGLWSRMSWQEIKESGRYIPPEDDPCAHL